MTIEGEGLMKIRSDLRWLRLYGVVRERGSGGECVTKKIGGVILMVSKRGQHVMKKGQAVVR